MYVIREAQEYHRNVELHLYRKVCHTESVGQSVYLRIKLEKIGERTHLLVDQTCFTGELASMGLKSLPLTS